MGNAVNLRQLDEVGEFGAETGRDYNQQPEAIQDSETKTVRDTFHSTPAFYENTHLLKRSRLPKLMSEPKKTIIIKQINTF